MRMPLLHPVGTKSIVRTLSQADPGRATSPWTPFPITVVRGGLPPAGPLVRGDHKAACPAGRKVTARVRTEVGIRRIREVVQYHTVPDLWHTAAGSLLEVMMTIKKGRRHSAEPRQNDPGDEKTLVLRRQLLRAVLGPESLEMLPEDDWVEFIGRLGAPDDVTAADRMADPNDVLGYVIDKLQLGTLSSDEAERGADAPGPNIETVQNDDGGDQSRELDPVTEAPELYIAPTSFLIH